jgi:two-component system, cell cycle response regulator
VEGVGGFAASQGPVRVLLAGGYPPLQGYIQSMLEDAGCEVTASSDVQLALVAEAGPGVDLVLVDTTALAAQAVQAIHVSRTIAAPSPVVMALTDSRVTASRLLEAESGIIDFVAVPFEPAELKARVRAAARAKRLRDTLLMQATTDPLTGLANRRCLELRATALIALARRHNRSVSCIRLDLDHFKEINDTLGHATGDAVLRDVAQALRSVTRVSDVVGRYAGDEFIILLPETAEGGAWTAAEKIQVALSGLNVAVPSGGNRAVHVQASIGIASCKESIASPAALFAAADDALYHAKATGRNRIVVRGWAPAA